MGFHWPELIIITAVALLIFGPKRLPEIGSAIGKTYHEFKKSLNDMAASATPDAEGRRSGDD
jgi:sec-independent protein translocase protein TatA